jgi:hypothetical protein
MELSWLPLQLDPGQNLTEQQKIFRKSIGPHVIKDYDHLIERNAESFVNRLEGFSGDPTEIVFQ